MTVSLKFRYKSRHKSEIQLSPRELKRRYAFRSRARCDRYYRVGDVRKAKDNGCSLDAKVKITKIAYCRTARKTRLTFIIVREHKEIRYINMEGFECQQSPIL